MPSTPGGKVDSTRGVTLGQVFAAGLFGLAALLALLYWLVVGSSGRAITRSALTLAAERSARVASKVEGHLQQAERAAADLENQVRYGACESEDPASVEAHLFAEVLNNPELAEATFTHAVLAGRDPDGTPRIARGGRWQMSIFRQSADTGSAILTRFTYADGAAFHARRRVRPPGAGLLDVPFGARDADALPDPTEHPTFTSPAATRPGALLWSDLSHSELDAHLPEARRRVVVTVLKAIADRGGRFAGVVRIGRLTRQIDEAVRPAPGEREQVFICDERGRLITKLLASDALRDLDGDLRVVPEPLPAAIGQALAHGALHEVNRREESRADAPEREDVEPLESSASGEFVLAGRRHLVSFRALARTQDWRLGVLVSEDELPGVADLMASRRALLWGALAVIGLILAGGLATLRAVRAGLERIVSSAARLRDFDFAPADVRTPFRDIREAASSLELAKTAMRAMGKYVPIDLVRQLYRTRQEPRLGGELREVSLMFTDIEGFTTLSESLPPDELARLLGRYLEVMTAAVHAQGGIIDKYIGDALMAIWNAPSPCSDHARQAARAALACQAATRALFDSAEWAGRPRLLTRFGLHQARVMVGHFGAPDRMAYTALGDGVNLASRLEGLNKQYGTVMLVSQALRDAAGAALEFRLLDRVAVKGKREGVQVYELLGPAGTPVPDAMRRYEQALERHWRRDFAGALVLLVAQQDDAPSRALAERCREYALEPPPADWQGVHAATSK